jgi:hypothetical protein
MRKVTIIVVCSAVFGFLGGLTYVNFATTTGHQLNILPYTILALLLGVLLSTWFLNWGQRISAIVVILGLVVFLLSITGGGCNAAGYPADADYGMAYDWATNTLKFGDNLNGTNYRCTVSPSRVGIFLGYVLISGGVLGILKTR